MLDSGRSFPEKVEDTLVDKKEDFLPERDRQAAAGASVPVIDISPVLSGRDPAEARAVVDAVATACEEVGFFVVVGHDVSEAAIQSVVKESDTFFSRPTEDKMRIKRPAPDVSRGFNSLADQSLARTLGVEAPPDLMESLGFGPLTVGKGPYWEEGHGPTYFHPNLWPDEMPDFRSAVERYYREMERLAEKLCRIFALALGKEENYFRDKIDRHISSMRINYYPAQASDPLPGQIRAGAHSDYDAFTILLTDSKGLQVVRRGGDWIDVPIVPNGFVIKIGDMLMRWTNDRWVSTLHRVVNPPQQARNKSRISVAFFQIPNHDVVMESFESCVGPNDQQRYATTTVGAHWRGKILAARGKD
jgi:isopenicillin N synthase-like dioxygenase